MNIIPTATNALSPQIMAANVPPSTSPDGISASSDFETFLKMMTAQIQNQDPLNPIDSADFAVQLATFSAVEQQVRTNDLLAGLSSQLDTSGLSQIAGWVGMEARVASPVAFDGAPITLYPDIAANADLAILVVKDENGNEVTRQPIDLNSSSFDWAGVNSSGSPLASGTYSFEIESSVNGDLIGTELAQSYATVNEAKLVDGALMIVLTGGVEIPASDVKAIRNPTP